MIDRHLSLLISRFEGDSLSLDKAKVAEQEELLASIDDNQR